MLTEVKKRKKHEEEEERKHLRGPKDTQGGKKGEEREQGGGVDKEGKRPSQETRRHMVKNWRQEGTGQKQGGTRIGQHSLETLNAGKRREGAHTVEVTRDRNSGRDTKKEKEGKRKDKKDEKEDIIISSDGESEGATEAEKEKKGKEEDKKNKKEAITTTLEGEGDGTTKREEGATGKAEEGRRTPGEQEQRRALDTVIRRAPPPHYAEEAAAPTGQKRPWHIGGHKGSPMPWPIPDTSEEEGEERERDWAHKEAQEHARWKKEGQCTEIQKQARRKQKRQWIKEKEGKYQPTREGKEGRKGKRKEEGLQDRKDYAKEEDTQARELAVEPGGQTRKGEDHHRKKEERNPLPQEEGGEGTGKGINTQETEEGGKEEERGDKTPE
jgi:hypothetical protein